MTTTLEELTGWGGLMSAGIPVFVIPAGFQLKFVSQVKAV
jgi:hypothetical protein